MVRVIIYDQDGAIYGKELSVDARSHSFESFVHEVCEKIPISREQFNKVSSSYGDIDEIKFIQDAERVDFHTSVTGSTKGNAMEDQKPKDVVINKCNILLTTGLNTSSDMALCVNLSDEDCIEKLEDICRRKHALSAEVGFVFRYKHPASTSEMPSSLESDECITERDDLCRCVGTLMDIVHKISYACIGHNEFIISKVFQGPKDLTKFSLFVPSTANSVDTAAATFKGALRYRLGLTGDEDISLYSIKDASKELKTEAIASLTAGATVIARLAPSKKLVVADETKKGQPATLASPATPLSTSAMSVLGNATTALQTAFKDLSIDKSNSTTATSAATLEPSPQQPPVLLETTVSNNSIFRPPPPPSYAVMESIDPPAPAHIALTTNIENADAAPQADEETTVTKHDDSCSTVTKHGNSFSTVSDDAVHAAPTAVLNHSNPTPRVLRSLALRVTLSGFSESPCEVQASIYDPPSMDHVLVPLRQAYLLPFDTPVSLTLLTGNTPGTRDGPGGRGKDRMLGSIGDILDACTSVDAEAARAVNTAESTTAVMRLDVIMKTTTTIPVRFHLCELPPGCVSKARATALAQPTTILIDPSCGSETFLQLCRDVATILLPGSSSDGNRATAILRATVSDQRGIGISDPATVRRGDQLYLYIGGNGSDRSNGSDSSNGSTDQRRRRDFTRSKRATHNDAVDPPKDLKVPQRPIVPIPVIPSILFEAAPPSVPELIVAPAELDVPLIPADAPRVTVANLSPLEHEVYSGLCTTAIYLNHAQVVALCKRTNNVEAAVNYYLSNMEIFEHIADEPVGGGAVPGRPAGASAADVAAAPEGKEKEEEQLSQFQRTVQAETISMGIELSRAQLIALCARGGDTLDSVMSHYWSNEAFFERMGSEPAPPAIGAAALASPHNTHIAQVAVRRELLNAVESATYDVLLDLGEQVTEDALRRLCRGRSTCDSAVGYFLDHREEFMGDATGQDAPWVPPQRLPRWIEDNSDDMELQRVIASSLGNAQLADPLPAMPGIPAPPPLPVAHLIPPPPSPAAAPVATPVTPLQIAVNRKLVHLGKQLLKRHQLAELCRRCPDEDQAVQFYLNNQADVRSW